MERESLKYKRNFRTKSPHRVFRAMKDVIDDLGYSLQDITEENKPKLKASPITDTATFEDWEIKGEKQIAARFNWMQAVLGIVCCIFALVIFFHVMPPVPELLSILWIVAASFLVGVGIYLFATASTRRKQLVEILMEGEAYKASATTQRAQQTDKPSATVTQRAQQTDVVADAVQETDVVADVNIAVTVYIASFARGREVREKIRPSDQPIIDQEFAQIEREIEPVLRSYMMRQGE